MKGGETQAGTSTFLQTGSMSFVSSNGLKYGGLIEQSFYKKITRQLSQLFNYTYSVAPAFTIVHYVITVIRLLQIAGPSLCSGYETLWSTSDSAKGTIAILSIFYHLIPPSARDKTSVIFLIIYTVLLVIIIVMLIVSAIVFQKSANLPSVLPPIISFYFASFGCVLHPIAFELGFSEIGRGIFERSEYHVGVVIAIFIISVLVSLVYFWIFLMIASQSLMFRPNSLLTVANPPQAMIFITQLIVTMLTGFGESLKDMHYVQAVLLFLSAATYFCSCFISCFYGGIVSPTMTSAFLATCTTSGLMCIVNAVILILEKKATLVFIILYIIVFLIAFFVSHIIWNKKRSKHLALLDTILDDPAAFDEVRSVNHFVNLAIDGFYVAHPVCINWQLFQYAIGKWPQHQMAWFIYAKFVSIYPEETQTLAWIFRMIVTKKVHGHSSKTVKEQSLSIARQREPNLSTDLKSKLNSVSKHVTSTKHKLRHVWDLAIQGNINDMEAATKRAIKEIEKSDAELLHIFRQFPNNRFVTRQYARFCHELKADRQAYMEMIEKTRLLQRGITVSKDQAHEFGLAVFSQLPDKINVTKESNTFQGPGTESMTTSQMEMETEDENNQELDDSLILVERIDSLVIPSVEYTTIYRTIIFLILFVAPIIFIFVYTPMFIDTLFEPLNHMNTITMIRTFLYQLTAFSGQRMFEVIDALPPAAEKNTTWRLPSSLGYSWETRNQLVYVCSSMTTTMQNIEQFRTYKVHNKYIEQAQSYIFDSIINYSYYNGLVPTPKAITVQAALSDFILQQKTLILENAKDSITAQDLNSSIILNPAMNVHEIVTTLDDALQFIISYISETDTNSQNIFQIIMIVIIIFVVIVFIVSLVCQLLWINSNKEQVYRCLTALPKNAVSALTENLRVLKKEAENSSSTMPNTEMNKQEDNIMKMFVIGGNSSGTQWFDAILLILCSVAIIALHIGCTIISISLLRDESSYIRKNCPHLNYLQGAYAQMMGSANAILSLLVNHDPDFNIGPLDKEYLVSKYDDRVTKARNYYHEARFGGTTINEPPYSGFSEGVAYAASQLDCEDNTKIPADLLEASKCYSADLVFILIESLWNSRVVPLNVTKDQYALNRKDPLFEIIWGLLIFPVYDAFFYPMTSKIISTTRDDLDEMKNAAYPGIIVMFVLAIVLEFIVALETYRIEIHMRKVLRLLLHVPSKVVMQTPKIMKVLGGDFKKQRGDSATRDTEFFRSVVSNLPDAVFIASQEMKIEAVNKSFVRILGVEEEVVIDKPVSDFINNDKFSGNVNTLIQINNNNKPKTESLIYKKEGTEVNLEATSIIINQRLVILFRDTTQTVRYNTLINEEKSKSDMLLSSILPPSLVKRVQAGEQNISFAVQSATIVFMDIVSFTPWCGSLPADKVMKTLNHLFKKFDAACAREPTMTKIKCIGDCYMAAGGVFAEVNQPAEHAKEVVRFGLDALQCVTDLNAELGETLQIRVGINTGGPIVAGVLGIGKPTFEILGPAINMAQQMEHHGVPMQVHISRSVYELIYGDAFVIKERGPVEVKGGTVITYLVSKKS